MKFGINQTYKSFRKSALVRVVNKQRIDPIREALIGHACVICGRTMQRRQFVGGTWEANTVFYKRKTCSNEIGTGRLHSPCRKELARRMAVEGITAQRKYPIKFCISCSRRLCYRGKSNVGHQTDYCYPCFQINRPLSDNPFAIWNRKSRAKKKQYAKIKL